MFGTNFVREAVGMDMVGGGELRTLAEYFPSARQKIKWFCQSTISLPPENGHLENPGGGGGGLGLHP